MTKNAVTPADEELELETDDADETEAEVTFTPKDLAAELGIDAKSFRRWLRNYTPERAADYDGRWAFTADRKAELIAAYNAPKETPEADEEADASDSETE